MAEQVRLIRPADLMVGTVELVNLVIAADGSRLVRVTAGEPAAVVVRLPPQHYLEPALTPVTADLRDFFGQPDVPAYVVPLLASKGAYFQWDIPDGVSVIEIGPDGLFSALNQFDDGVFVFDALANLGFGTKVSWHAPPAPDGSSRHPLWRIRPDVPDGATFEAGSPVHAAIRETLDAVLVTTSGPDHELGRNLLKEAGLDGPAGVTVSNPFPFFMRRFLARRMTATALGGTVWLFGPDDTGDNPFSYEHRTSLGRDVYVRHAVWGWLSSGHRAVITTVSERVLRRAALFAHGGGSTNLTTTATMVARAELAVTEPVLDVAAHAGEYPHGGREIPFRSLRIDLDRCEVDVSPTPQAARMVTMRGSPIHFDLTGVDHAGRAVTLRMPLSFLPDGVPVGDLVQFVPQDGTGATLATTPVTLTPEAGRPPGSTTITVAGLGIGVTSGASRPVLPELRTLQVGIDALAGLSGRVPVVRATLHQAYRQQGLDRAANPLGALLDIAAQKLELPTASVGGVGNPGGVVDLITAERGAVAAALAGGPPSPEQIAAAFPLPKLLGTIDLRKLLDGNSFPRLPNGLPTVPQVTRLGPPGGETLAYHFEAKLTRSVPDLGLTVAPDAKLTLDARISRAGAGVVATSNGVVTGIRFEIAGVVRLRFAKIQFVTDAGGKTTVDVGGVDVDFLGAFEFLAEIARRLATLGTGSGARVDVDSNGVTAGFQLAIPTLAMGIMQLSNLSIAAFLRIPLADAPLSFTLDVARRDRPFQATVSMFGGGGFLSLEVRPSGVRRLEAAVEFGGSVSLNIVVASGGVSLMAGIYFGLKEIAGRQEIDASGFVRASGHLSVLGIVSIFVEFRLALTYRQVTIGASTHAMFAGTASVTVGVKVLFFSKSVTLTVTREFLGSAADPGFTDCLTESDWDDYCLAYAGSGPPAVAGEAFGGGST